MNCLTNVGTCPNLVGKSLLVHLLLEPLRQLRIVSANMTVWHLACGHPADGFQHEAAQLGEGGRGNGQVGLVAHRLHPRIDHLRASSRSR